LLFEDFLFVDVRPALFEKKESTSSFVLLLLEKQLHFFYFFFYFYFIVQTMPHDCAEKGHDYHNLEGGGAVCKFCDKVVALPGKI
jgi:hypothetical protein